VLIDVTGHDTSKMATTKVISGVPQGSVLGPILFIIWIKDIDSVCHGRTNMKLFADSAKLYSEIELNDCSLFLQTSLNNLATKAFAWQLSINVQKCCVLSTVINRRTSHSGSNKYYLNGVLCIINVNILDLGITILEKLWCDIM